MASSLQQDVQQTTEHELPPPSPADSATTSSTTYSNTGAVPPVATGQTATPSASDRAYNDERAKRSAELTAKHGVRPRDYSGGLDGNNTAELLIREVMPQITTFLNGRAAAQKLQTRFTTAELTTNFLAEGGILAIKDNITEELDGFSYAGVDTFMDRYAELTPWLHPGITKDKVSATEATNEKGEKVRSIGRLTLVQAAWANATMYAAAKARFEKWLGHHGRKINGLTDVEQFYWSTTYYNAGEGHAQKSLAAVGVGAANTKWSRPDDWQRYYTNATYNAKMRTSTFEMTRDEGLQHDEFRPMTPENQQAVSGEVTGQIDSLRERVNAFAPQVDNYDARLATAQQSLAANKGNAEMTAMYQMQIDELKDAKRQYESLAQQLDVLESAQRHQLTGR